MQYLLDTNACIAIMRKHPTVVQHWAAVSPSDCSISTITSYELLTGVEKCANPSQELQKVETLLANFHVLDFDEPAAQQAARVRALLESLGQMIGA